MRFQLVVNRCNDLLQIDAGSAGNQDGVDLLASILYYTHNGAVANLAEFVQDAFNVFGVNIEPFRRDDRILNRRCKASRRFRS